MYSYEHGKSLHTIFSGALPIIQSASRKRIVGSSFCHETFLKYGNTDGVVFR